MAGDRRRRILDLLGAGDAELETARLCDVCAEVTGASGAGIMVMTGDVPLGSLCTTNAVSARLEDLQYMLGEGPCVDAYHEDRPVLEPDLASPETVRWLAFTGAAVEAGARRSSGFPSRSAPARLGALNLYSSRPGPLTDDQHADALVVAELAAEAVLVMQHHAPPGTLADQLVVSANLQSVVHQAAGMVAVQLDVSVIQALIRLRAHAFANDALLANVAEDVVRRRVRFSDSGATIIPDGDP